MSSDAARQERVLGWCARVATGVVVGLAVLNWFGWATDDSRFTRIFSSWPHMPPWSALIQLALAVAIVLQVGHQSPAMVWAGRGLAAAGGILSAVFLAEYVTGTSFGLDRVFFSGGVAAAGSMWPGRPSVQTAVSVAMLAIAVSLTRSDRRWTSVVWSLSLTAAMVVPTITALDYLFEAVLLMDATRSTGQAIGSVVSLLLLAAATFASRPDRNPLAWLLARPDLSTLIRLVAIMAGLPMVMGVSRLVFINLGLSGDGAWVSAITVSSVLVGMAVFFSSQREQRLLIEKESLSAERADAEARYRLLLEATPDALIIVGPDGRITLANAQTDRMFGYPRAELMGREVELLLPPRFRGSHVRHRMDFFAHPAVRMMGVGLDLSGLRSDGTEFPVAISLSPLHTGRGLEVLAAIRDVTERREYEERLRRQNAELVETHGQLEQLARFDTLTGLVNRAEAMARLESALMDSRVPGAECGVLFCDVDRFKAINDTYGHTVGDVVLRTLAERICESVRSGDTVGRTGGDEILVLLPGLHSAEEATRIAEKIRDRAAEPIHHAGRTLDVGLSIGVTLAIRGESVVDTVARADEAMYEAKRRGGSAVIFL